MRPYATRYVMDVTDAPPESEEYGNMKRRLFGLFDELENARNRNLLKTWRMGDENQSYILHRLRSFGNKYWRRSCVVNISGTAATKSPRDVDSRRKHGPGDASDASLNSRPNTLIRGATRSWHMTSRHSDFCRWDRLGKVEEQALKQTCQVLALKFIEQTRSVCQLNSESHKPKPAPTQRKEEPVLDPARSEGTQGFDYINNFSRYRRDFPHKKPTSPQA